jgi:uncharacterized protein (TIGR03663 family)
VVAVAAVLRSIDLGSRPMHHDESLDAFFAWRLLTDGVYSYDPVYHGPLRFYLTAGLFKVLGATEAVARTLAAVSGVAVVALMGATRRWLGDVGSLAAATMVAFSPSMLYFSRFGREDLLFALVELAILVLVLSWLSNPTPWHPPVLGAVLAAAFATKETSYIVVAVLGLYLGFLVALELLDRRRGRPTPDTGVCAALAAPGRRALLWGLATFAFTFSLLFSVGFTDLGGIWDGAVEGIRYWLSQQPVNRGSQPWPYYLAILVGYELPILILAAGGVVVALRRSDPARGLIVWTAFAYLVIYSWASERFPWLVVHPLVPVILLAGLGCQALWEAGRRAVPRPVFLLGAGALVAVMLAISVPVVYREPNDPRQLLVAVQTGPELLEVRARLESLYESAPEGRPPVVVIDTSDSATWPWGWYLREWPVEWKDLSAEPEAVVGADVVLSVAGNVDRLPVPEGGWESEPYEHRVWWLPAWEAGGAGDWLAWFTRRRTFGDVGALDAVELRAPQGW